MDTGFLIVIGFYTVLCMGSGVMIGALLMIARQAKRQDSPEPPKQPLPLPRFKEYEDYTPKRSGAVKAITRIEAEDEEIEPMRRRAREVLGIDDDR